MEKILLIEDNFDVRENTAEILELSGYEVIVAENGKIGVQKALEHIPDLIICDIMMPELDGYGVLRILQRNPKTSTIPFIYLTAKAERADFRQGMKLGADDYLTKPFDDVELLEAVQTRLSKVESLNQVLQNSAEGFSAFIDEARGQHAMEELSKDREVRHFGKKGIIYQIGDFPRQVFYVKKGKVKISRTNEDGRNLIVALIGEGEFFGYLSLLKGTPYPENAIALSNTELSVIPKHDFFTLLNNNRDVSSRFIQLLASDILEVEEQLIDLAYNSVRKRVADALLRLKERYDRNPEEDTFTIAILRDDLASMVGTAKETVIRMLSDFKEENLIEIKGSRITIINETGLENMWN